MNRQGKNKYLSAVVKSGIFLVWLFLSLPVCSQDNQRKYPFYSLESGLESRRIYLDTVLNLMRSDRYNLEVNFPEEGWTKQSINVDFDLKLNDVICSSYRIVSEDNRVMILYFAWHEEDSCSWKEGNYVDYYRRTGRADTLSERKIFCYDKEYALEKFGTEYAGQYPYNVEELKAKGFGGIRNLDVYSRCEIVWFYHPENNNTLVYLEYYYIPDEYPRYFVKSHPAMDIDKYIKETAGMIRFKEKTDLPDKKEEKILREEANILK